MKRGKTYAGTLAVLALVACTGLALAQAPDWQGPAEAGNRPGAPARGQALMRGLAAFPFLVGPELGRTEVTNTDAGVELKITVNDPNGLGPLQERTERSVINLQQLIERRRERGPQGPAPGRERVAFMGLLATGDVEVSSRKTEDGVVVTFTSDKPEVVQALQQNMPQWVAQATDRAAEQAAQLAERVRQQQEALALLANDAVNIEVKEVGNGLTINVTSADPEVARQIKEKLADYYRNQKELAALAGRLGARREGPPAAPLGPQPDQPRRQRREGRPGGQ